CLHAESHEQARRVLHVAGARSPPPPGAQRLVKRLAVVSAALLACLLACACKKTPPAPAAAADAGTGAEAGSAAISELPFVVVAEGPAGVRLTKTSDGRIVVADGPMLYEAKPDGTLAPIIPASEMGRFL